MAPRSRSRAAVSKSSPITSEEGKRERSIARAAPVKRARSVSRPPVRVATPKKEAVNPAAVIPSKAKKLPVPGDSTIKTPEFINNIDFMEVLTKFFLVLVPAVATMLLIEKYDLVNNYFGAWLTSVHGDKGKIFALSNMLNFLFCLFPILTPFVGCSRLNTGMSHRIEMAIDRITSQFGSFALAIVGVFVMQVPTAVTFTYAFTFLVANGLYLLAMMWKCEMVSNYALGLSRVSLAFLHYAFIKLRLFK